MHLSIGVNHGNAPIEARGEEALTLCVCVCVCIFMCVFVLVPRCLRVHKCICITHRHTVCVCLSLCLSLCVHKCVCTVLHSHVAKLQCMLLPYRGGRAWLCILKCHRAWAVGASAELAAAPPWPFCLCPSSASRCLRTVAIDPA
jgi:hypothetical protein